jgi:hypothetical protein
VAALVLVGVIPWGIQQINTQAHLAEVRQHMIAYSEAYQRYNQDNGNVISAIGSTLIGTSTQDYQAMRVEGQWLQDNASPEDIGQVMQQGGPFDGFHYLNSSRQ